MSLIKGRTMTEKNREAHQRNARKSRGPATPEGKERSRAASLRHGFYSQERDEALTALGEDPAELDALLGATREHWRPADDFEARASDRLARLLWRMDRAERIQESLVANLAIEHKKRRREVALHLRYEFNPHFDLLEGLLQSGADPRFYTTPWHLHWFCEAFGNPPENAVEYDFLLLLHRLRRPPDPARGPVDQETHPPDGNEKSPLVDKEGCPNGGVAVPSPERTVPGSAPFEPSPAPSAEAVIDDPFLRSQAELDQDDFPIPWPDVDVAEGPEREALRQELLVRARNLLAIEHAARDPAIKEHEAPLSRLQLDLVLATPNHHAELMRREEDRCFRQFARLGNLMVKFQTHAEKCAKNEGASGYVDETKERRQDHSDENAESERGSAESDVRSPRSEAGDATPGAKLETQTIDSRQSNIDPGLPEFQSAEPLEVARAATPGKSGDSKFKIQDSGQVPGTNPPRGRPEVQ